MTTAHRHEDRVRAHHRIASLVFVTAGLTWAALHGLGMLGPLETSTFHVFSVATFLATVLGIIWYRPSAKWPWLAIAGAMMLFVAGGVARVELGTFGNLTSTRSLIPDLITLPGYVFFAVGLTALARRRRKGQRGNFDSLLDCAIAALAALAIAWVFIITPTLDEAAAPLPVRMVLTAYPVMSVFLLAVTARIAFSPATRKVLSFRLLLLTMVLLLAGDTVYMLVELGKILPPIALIDLPYSLAYIGFGAVVLHHSMRELSDPVPSDKVAPSRGRLAFVAVALAIPAIVTLSKHNSSASDRIVLTAIVGCLTGAAILRMFLALREHARSEAALAHQATHDLLTGLPNRMVAREHVSSALRNAAASRARIAVVFLDVDRFKLVNDTVGHSLGDELLVAVARRLRETVRGSDLVARTGGDEFVIVLDDVSDVAQAMEFAERIRESFERPFLVRGSEIFASASLGVAFADGRDGNVDFESMIRDADTAMYQAKDAGRDGVAVFDASMRDRASERLALETDLRGALERHELDVHFQPIIALPHGPAMGLEALVRWSHPERGQVSPAKFVPIAEETGLIVDIGGWVLDEACRLVAEWRRDVPAAQELYVCVNLSARQLRDPSLVVRVAEALSRHDLPPRSLCLELTESILMTNYAEAEVLNDLKKLGVRLSIDDFGTGYSSLAYLKRFPLDCVKIDRAFVDGLDRPDSSDESLVAAIVAMAGALGMTTIAEGVETAAQERRLIDLGCRAVQGYRYSSPVAGAKVPDALRRAIQPLRAVLASA